MNASGRCWLILVVLTVAAAGLHHLSNGEAVPLSKPLKTFPLQMQGWQGTDLPLEPRIVQALGVSDYLDRAYQSADNRPVFLYVGYYKSQRTGVSIHSPKNCLPGAGWEPVTAGHVALRLPNGERAIVNQYVVENGLRRQFVLYWYQSHGRVIASEYRGKVYMVLDSLRLNRTDAALVRVSSPIGKEDEPGSSNQVLAFAQEFLARSAGIIPD
jgi:EpsI family protein